MSALACTDCSRPLVGTQGRKALADTLVHKVWADNMARANIREDKELADMQVRADTQATKLGMQAKQGENTREMAVERLDKQAPYGWPCS